MTRIILCSLVLVLLFSGALSLIEKEALALRELGRFHSGLQALTNSNNPCQSHSRIVCNPKNTSIIGLDLSNLGLSSLVIPLFQSFSELESLDLSFNSFSGPLPSILFSLPSLKTLKLARNTLSRLFQQSSELPSNLLLEHLDLRDSSLTGEIPPELSSKHFPHLSVLVLRNNRLSGKLPLTLSSLIHLRTLDLSSNLLEGRISLEWGRLSALEVLNLSNNKFTGGVPVGIFSLPNLRVLNLGSNNLGSDDKAIVTLAPTVAPQNCPPLTKRCNGSCIADSEKCQVVCSKGQKLCFDGTCSTSLNCSAKLLNGCPSPLVLCGDGSCVSDSSDCLCKSGGFRCVDLSCNASPQKCVSPPWRVPFPPFSGVLNVTQGVHLLTADGSPLIDVSLSLPTSAGSLFPSIFAKVSSVWSSEYLFSSSVSLQLRSPVIKLELFDKGTGNEIVSSFTLTFHFPPQLQERLHKDQNCLAAFEHGRWFCLSEVQAKGLQLSAKIIQGGTYSVLAISTIAPTVGDEESRPLFDGKRMVIFAVCLLSVFVFVGIVFVWKSRRFTPSGYTALQKI